YLIVTGVQTCALPICETLDQTIRALYARRRAVIGCCVSTILSLILNSGEIWIALYALNLHATMVNAIILQSMALTIRSVAFPVREDWACRKAAMSWLATFLEYRETPL